MVVTPAGNTEPEDRKICFKCSSKIRQLSTCTWHSDMSIIAIDWEGKRSTNLPVFRRGVDLVGAKDPKHFTTMCIYPSTVPVHDLESYPLLYMVMSMFALLLV